MKCVKAFAIVVCVGACLPALVWGQAMPAQAAAGQLGYNALYCAGFITDRSLQEGLFVIAGEEGGMKNEFVVGDILYLNKGSAWITNPSGEYVIVRRVTDFVKQEVFPGQRRLVEGLGTMYAEVGRIRVNIVHEQSATAQVLQTCESITVGDIAIPFSVKPAPPLKPSAGFDRFAPPTGKTGGMIVTGKEFVSSVGTGETIYLDIGGKDGVAVGQYYRVYRPYTTYGYDSTWRYMHNYPEKATGVRLGMRLTRTQQMTLPREVLGELVITHVEGRSATGQITFSQKEIFVGDQVELE